MGYYHQLRALMNEAAIGYIKSIRKDGDTASRDLQVFRFIATCLDFNLAPTFLIRTGLVSLEKWITGREAGGELHHQRSTIIDDLDKVAHYLRKQSKVRVALTAECERIRAIL